MSETESTDPGGVTDDRSAVDTPRPVDDPAAMAGIDPEDEHVVVDSLTALVAAARHSCNAIEHNGIYPAQVAVAAVEDVIAGLARIVTRVAPYSGDWSKQAGKHVERTAELLVDARTELSSARTDLRLDEPLANRSAAALV